MSLNTGIGLVDSLASVTITDLLKYQAQKNQAKIDLGAAKSANYVAELNAQATLLAGQMQALNQAKAAQSGGILTDSNGRLSQAALLIGGGVALFFAWKLLK